MKQAIISRKWLVGHGVEIGPGTTPIPTPNGKALYVDCFTEFGGVASLADYYGHAEYLPFRQDSLDFVSSSHVLEHCPNVIEALAEWYRVVAPGGVIYIIVPDKRITWDLPRALTGVDHFVADFYARTTAVDATHIDDFVYGVDWRSFSPSTPPDRIESEQAKLAASMHSAVMQNREINIHFHTFQRANLFELVELLKRDERFCFDWEVVFEAEAFPAENPIGYLIVLRVLKRPFSGRRFLGLGRGSIHEILLPEAIDFKEFKKRCEGIGGTIDLVPKRTSRLDHRRRRPASFSVI